LEAVLLPASKILEALADETRRSVLQKLREGKISSGELALSVGISPQALSYHLAKLKKAGLIFETKEKNFIYYETDFTVLDEVIVWLNGLKGGKKDE
jgi:DNA-binding transcriptional ArsR family regulator